MAGTIENINGGYQDDWRDVVAYTEPESRRFDDCAGNGNHINSTEKRNEAANRCAEFVEVARRTALPNNFPPGPIPRGPSPHFGAGRRF